MRIDIFISFPFPKINAGSVDDASAYSGLSLGSSVVFQRKGYKIVIPGLTRNPALSDPRGNRHVIFYGGGGFQG